MCYSAQLVQDHREYLRAFPGARVGIEEFARLTEARWSGQKALIPKGMAHSFLYSDRPEDQLVAGHLRRYDELHEHDLRAELASQQQRLEKAEADLKVKETKKARDSLRIAGNKIKNLQRQLLDLERRELLPKDSRVYPQSYAPVLVKIDGELRILPMRYLLRPQGRPPEFDKEYSGCYNARRDNLQKFWRKQFGVTHGVVMMERFYENVSHHDYERRPLTADEKPTSVVVEFEPSDGKTMFVACLWSHWQGAGDDLHSFAIITDEPPPEVRETGHDRCVVQIQRERVEEWLDTTGKSDEDLLGILSDKPAVRYQHRLTKTEPAGD